MPTLGRVPGERYYASTEHKIGLELPEGVIVVRLDAPLIFANAEAFHARISQLVADADEPPHTVVANLETVDFIDTDGGDELRAIKDDLDEHAITLRIARLNRDGQRALADNDVYDRIGEDCFHPTVEDAVNAAAGDRDDAEG